MKEILRRLFDYVEVKLLLAHFFVFLSWSFDGKTQIIYTVYSLIALDTVTGIWAVFRIEGVKGLSSRKFFRAPMKFVVYLTFLYVSRAVDKGLPVNLAAPIMDAFLVTTEAVSILENFSKLGYPVPTFLISKLKSYFEKKADDGQNIHGG